MFTSTELNTNTPFQKVLGEQTKHSPTQKTHTTQKEHTTQSPFINRHIGLTDSNTHDMLQTLQCKSLDDLIDKVTPQEIRTRKELNIPSGITEQQCLKKIQGYANKNQIFKSYIGMGYYDTHLPTVIQRNILENPVWLTSYTPYQSEISQGRLQALLNFQTMIIELTEMEVANASLLDEGTACAEAVSIAYNNRFKQSADHIFVDQSIFPQTLEVIQTRAQSAEWKVVIGEAEKFSFNDQFFCVVIQTPSASGKVNDWEKLCQMAKQKNILTIFSADPLSLCLFKTPSAMGADIVTGSCQRLGLPMMFGGPHAAYLATKQKYIRSLPGRIVGVSKDRHGNKALRLTMQTREQHIRREKATSNICTAQALLANVSSMYALYHGPEGLKKIATDIHLLALLMMKSLRQMGLDIKHTNIFDTVQVQLCTLHFQNIYKKLIQNKINPNCFNEGILSFSINETSTREDIIDILEIFYTEVHGTDCEAQNKTNFKSFINSIILPLINTQLIRQSPCLKHSLFQLYHSETKLLRYIHRLQNQDISLTHSMIPLGSCTMKLNSTTELMPVTWPQFANIHPFAPTNQVQGYHQIIQELEQHLCEITGFDGISFQPNAGSQGEYTGLLIIRRYHEQNFDKKNSHCKKRDICLIPSSAHGTNPASAQMAGLKTITVSCDKEGNISHEDLKNKIEKYKDTLATLMITYPSTSGVFEAGIPEICRQVHAAGGLVYLDGANMNALIGISRPAEWGADVCHLNLHKTFCIPHGGGGPGMGPVAVTQALKKFLPQHSVIKTDTDKERISAVSSAPWGSAGILMISWAYIQLMGNAGLKKATQVAILNANYIAHRLKKHFKCLYTGKNNMVAHECIIDVRKFRNTSEITVDDIAKRLMDYGFHAPTMSWPVPGTLMIEPTESEDKEELDRFCSALIEIRKEIQEIEERKYGIKENVLKKAPHTLTDVIENEWQFPYSQQKAFYPLPWVKKHKFWPVVSRVENAYGDINLFCSCPPVQNSDFTETVI